MTTPLTAFLPCRRGSERVKHKNTRPFAGMEGGLLAIKLAQLGACDRITRIVVSTDDPEVREITTRFARELPDRVHVAERPPELATSRTSTDDLVRHVPSLVESGDVLWTHVTSPFVDAKLYAAAFHAYHAARAEGRADSLMSVTPLQTFIWDENGPVNYRRKQEKWPRTQTLPRWYEVNSAVFIAPIETYVETGDRIGHNPHLFELDFPASVDIDTEPQFRLAERIWRQAHAS
jgi:CMP-N-acetylneuraminic acid synthetase